MHYPSVRNREMSHSDMPSRLEKQAMDAILSGSEPWKTQLRMQLKYLRVRERHDTGAGFYTYFALSPGASRVQIPPHLYSVPPQAFAEHSDIPGGSFFLLWLKDGYIDFLEGAIGPSWTGTEEGFRFKAA